MTRMYQLYTHLPYSVLTGLATYLVSVLHKRNSGKFLLCIVLLLLFKINCRIENPTKCEVRCIVWFLNSQNLKPAEIWPQLRHLYSDVIMNERNVRKWCEMFRQNV